MKGSDSREVLARFNAALDLVDTIARQLRRKLGALVEHDDLVSFGREGLLDAARRYDESRGVPFRVYASFRVRGATYDGVRRTSALPRGLYEKLESLEAQALASEGEAPYTFAVEDSAREAAEAQEVLADHLAGMAMAATLGLIAEADSDAHASRSATDPSSNPEQAFANAEILQRIQAELEGLDAEEREVIRRHYFEGEPLENAAAALNISKSWASRLHTRALARLGKRLQGLRTRW